MRLSRRGLVALLLALPFSCAASEATPPAPQACKDDAGWNDPAQPLKIHGNTWFVGTCGISAVLITSDAGHVLIDGGTEKGATLILANIRTLGFDPRDVKLILNSHEHHDHAGGLAALQQATGADVVVRAPTLTVLARGKSDRSDPQFLDLNSLPVVSRLRALADGEILEIGRLRLKAHATPGHSPGGTSWTWTSCEGSDCRGIAYVDSLSSISDKQYRYSDHPEYLAAFRRTLKTVAALPCDVLLTPHPSASAMWSRLGAGATDPLAEPDGCKTYAANAMDRLEARLAEEHRAKAKP
ncbi:subclass B3 metallo-beta-lactamase [Arenimonas sp.]|uniref:subclass B3 metallo-beta-lactamase n=1 Tax=Arenimonas sp. TaxID=1872635 RepID=UPI0039E56147